jgi:hypothetical protein
MPDIFTTANRTAGGMGAAKFLVAAAPMSVRLPKWMRIAVI